MFERLDPAPPDPILGLTAAFAQDANPDKINLGVGVYQDSQGRTPVLESVKLAERRLLQDESTKSYLPIDGDPTYDHCVRELLAGAAHPLLDQNRIVTAQTPGGTGALRVAADYLHAMYPQAIVWLSDPTWANHPNIFAAAGVPTAAYPYFDATTEGVAFDAMCETLGQASPGDVVLLHGCCHNPTGADLSDAQWRTLAGLFAERGLLPLVDFAYQGFGDGLDEDAAGLRTLCDEMDELLIASSFSKNFGLYNERVGALTVVASTAVAAQTVLSRVKICIRRNYSNPPAHGGRIVAAVLTDEQLRARWKKELASMRDRINAMRSLFVDTLEKKNAPRDFAFLASQRGMFSYSGLTPAQVKQLRDEHSVYMVGSGRINVAGLTPSNVERVCDAVVSVLSAT